MHTFVRKYLFPLVLLSAPALFAQGTGSITGSVRDNTGAVVPNAEITLTAQGTQVSLHATTNAEGEYLLAAVPPGTYDLAVTAAGFNKFESKGIILRVAQRARVDASLIVGEVKTAVTVEGSGITQVETESSEVSGVVTGKQVSQLVLNGRNFTQLITLTPGVSNQTGQDEGTVGVYGSVGFSVNGGRTEYNNWEIDGGDNMDNGSNGTLNVYPNVDAIAEVRVLTSNYGAQYGRNGSGTVETVTKSGTQAFHGNAFEFVRNDVFNARNFFADTVPSYKKNDFGYTIGGPVWIPGHYNRNKDKTFFFWSQEWRKERLPNTFNIQVPSNEERQGIFNDVCPAGGPVNKKGYPDCPVNPATGAYFPNNTVAIDPNAQSIMAMVPAPTYGSGANSFFNASPASPTNWREELVRVDQNFSDTNRFFFRYIHDSWNTITPTSLWSGDSFPTVGTNFVGPGVSLVAHMTNNITPTLLNEFTFSYTTDHIFLTPFGAWQRPSSMTMTGFFDNGFGGKLPGMSINNGTPYGGGFTADVAGWPWNNANPTYTYRDQIAKIWGSHNIYTGFYFAAAQKNENNGAETQGFLNFSNSSPVSTGNAWADFLAGNISSFNQNNMQTKYYYRSKVFEPYFQDDWHVSRKLTLNLGIRMSGFGSYYEKNNLFYNFYPSMYDPSQAPQIDVTGKITGQQGALVPGVGNPYTGEVACGTNGTPNTCYKGHFWNWAPRVGFAFDPFGDGKWAIRAGWGMFYEHLNGNEAISGLEGQPPGILNPTQYNTVGYTNLGSGGLSGTTGITTYPDQIRWPYMQQFHLDVQHDLWSHIVGSVSYVGNKGTHLVWQRDINQLHPTQPSQNPFHPGQPLTDTECNTVQNPWLPNVSGIVNGQTVTGQTAQNLAVACGKSPSDPYRQYTGYSGITLIEPQANSNYNALQVSLRRQAARSQFTVAYTYSHAIDNASDRYDGNFLDSYNMARTRSSSNFDQRHILNIGYVLESPFFTDTKKLSGKLLGGWQLSGLTTFQTGTPFSITAGNANGIYTGAGVGNSAGSGAYADVIGDANAAPPITNAADIKGPLLFNPAAFAAPTGLTFGNAGRNIMTNPSRLNFDMGLFKKFFVTETMNFEFRAEAFNVFNHTQWSGVNRGISCYGGAGNSPGDASCLDTSFLHPSGAHNPRILQLGMKFIF
jgi:hypothetical protein